MSPADEQNTDSDADSANPPSKVTGWGDADFLVGKSGITSTKAAGFYDRDIKRILIARIENEERMRELFSAQLRAVFIHLNTAILVIIIIMLIAETILIMRGFIKPEQRIINTRVIMAIIAGTVVQTGAAFLVVMGYLFPKNKIDALSNVMKIIKEDNHE